MNNCKKTFLQDFMNINESQNNIHLLFIRNILRFINQNTNFASPVMFRSHRIVRPRFDLCGTDRPRLDLMMYKPKLILHNARSCTTQIRLNKAKAVEMQKTKY